MRIMRRLTPGLIDRYWQKVLIQGPDDCWPWTAATRSRDGYGAINSDNSGGMMAAHRIAYALGYGTDIPDGLCVCHTCDNPKCCNPAHLFIGTKRDNYHDAIQKDRVKSKGRRFTLDQIRHIRRLYDMGVSAYQIARGYDMTYASVRRVAQRISYPTVI